MVSRFRPLVIVLGVGEIASAAAHRLFKSRFRVIMTEDAFERELHRFTTYSRVFTDGMCEVEGVPARTAVVTEAVGLVDRGSLPVLSVDARSAVDALNPGIVVDARESGRTSRAEDDYGAIRVGDVPFIVAAHREFSIGEDCDMAVIVQRGRHMGRPVGNAFEGLQILPQVVRADTQDGAARLVAPSSGIFIPACRIGASVAAGDAVGEVDGKPVEAPQAGIVKGILAAGAGVEPGTAVAELEGGDTEDMVYIISDRARAVAGTILELAVSWAVDTGALAPPPPYEPGS
jgi:xanthine dehydrogenase accessory factor